MHQPVVAFDDAEVEVHALRAHGHRERRLAVLVELDHLAVVEVGQDVAVDRDERPPQVVDRAEGTRGAQRLSLPMEGELKVRRKVGICEVHEDELAEVADAQVDPVDPALAQRADEMLEHRPVADRDQGLRYHRGVRTQPRPQTSRKYDRPHWSP